MHERTYVVQGMTCEHCVRAVADEVGRLPGVSGVEVDLGSGRVHVVSQAPLADPAVRAAVEEAGYALAEVGP
jgi:copper ion binding protein